MRNRRMPLLPIGLAAVTLGIACMTAVPKGRNPALGVASFEQEVQDYEVGDRIYPLPGGSVVLTGDSRIKQWEDLDGSLGPYRLLNRGVTAATIGELQVYVDRLVVPYAPSAVVVYVGEEDLLRNRRATAERRMAEMRRLLARIRVRLPRTPVFVLSLVPSPKNLDAWPALEEVNSVMASLLDGRTGTLYVDVAGPMLNEEGGIRPELYADDGIRLSKAGYELWGDTLLQSLTRVVAPQ